MTDLATLQLRYAEADLAYHRIMTNQSVVSLSYDGKSATYSRANIGELKAYMADLKSQIAALSGVRVRRGPIYATF